MSVKDNNKILILGGAGFLGFFTAKRLSDNPANIITIIDNHHRGKLDKEFSELLLRDNVKYINGDVTNMQTLIEAGYDFNYIYNFAAVIGVKNVENMPDKVLYVNCISMLNLFEYAKNINGLNKIFFASTSEVYSGTMHHYGIEIPTDESVPLVIQDIRSNRTTYALSKIFGESVAHIYGNKYNIPYTIGRYHNVYGPRMGYAHVIPETFIKINNNDEILVPSAHHTRAFCYVDDAVNMTILVAEDINTNGETFHIGNSDEEIQIIDLVKAVSKVMNKHVTIIKDKETPGSSSRRAPNVDKLHNIVNYKAKISLIDGLMKTYQWYIDKLELRWE